MRDVAVGAPVVKYFFSDMWCHKGVLHGVAGSSEAPREGKWLVTDFN